MGSPFQPDSYQIERVGWFILLFLGHMQKYWMGCKLQILETMVKAEVPGWDNISASFTVSVKLKNNDAIISFQ